jgi:predicted nucleotidyltransferase
MPVSEYASSMKKVQAAVKYFPCQGNGRSPSFCARMSRHLVKLEHEEVTETELTHVVDKIRNYFAEKPGIVAVYLYGSLPQGRITSFSDVDIGVLYAKEQIPNFEEQVDDSIALSDQLQREVDLVNLNTVSPVLRMQVLKRGQVVLNLYSVFICVNLCPIF